MVRLSFFLVTGIVSHLTLNRGADFCLRCSGWVPGGLGTIWKQLSGNEPEPGGGDGIWTFDEIGWFIVVWLQMVLGLLPNLFRLWCWYVFFLEIKWCHELARSYKPKGGGVGFFLINSLMNDDGFMHIFLEPQSYLRDPTGPKKCKAKIRAFAKRTASKISKSEGLNDVV